jgi:large subunit ribosomal protein L24
MSKWIKKGDKVVVVSGNDKGRTGTILRKKGDRVVVQGINIRKKHAKRRAQAQTPTILEIEVPIHISNVQLCDENNKPIKLKVRSTDKGEKELFYLQDKKEVVFRAVKKT